MLDQNRHLHAINLFQHVHKESLMQEDTLEENPQTSTGGFLDLPLSPLIREAIETIGYETPSPIQAKAIPYLAEGRDLLGVAQTGTGKTAAFALPLLGRLDTTLHAPQILCLTPTRELAIQVAEAIETFGQKMKGLRVLPIYGGTEYGGQLRSLKKGVHVVVGTPGRVMDHIKRGTLKLEKLQALVLDEADEMLSMGFIDDVEWMLEHTPKEIQTALFSATMPRPIRKLSEKYLNDPAEVTIRLEAKTMPNIRQRYLKLRQAEKSKALKSLLEIEPYDAVLIFARTKVATGEIVERLQTQGYNAETLNGDMSQSLREKTVARLKSGKLDIIVATDVAARGLDVERISHVVNYDAPFDVESYVHRIGRTGRAGRTGDAILFVCGRETRILSAVQHTLKIKCERYEFPSADELNQRKQESLFDTIDKTLEKDLSEYLEVLGDYSVKNPETEPLKIAAALAHLGADGKPFRIKEAPKFDNSGRNEERHRTPDGKHEPGGKHEPDANFETYRIEVGLGNGVQKGDLVGALANEAGLDPSNIGKIQLFQDFGLIDLPKGMPREIFNCLKKIWVRGQKISISKDQGRPPHRNNFKRKRPFSRDGKKPSQHRKGPSPE
jgi:ATP-dependent RNA helicase DeaD